MSSSDDVGELFRRLYTGGGGGGGGCQVCWASIDPRNHRVIDYDTPTTLLLEDAFLRGVATSIPLQLGSAHFTVELDYEDIRQFRQKNNTGGARRVIRVAPPNRAPAMHPGLISHVYRIADAVDHTVLQLMESEATTCIGNGNGSRFIPSHRPGSGATQPQPPSDGELAPLLAVYDSILEAMWSPPIRARYGFTFNDDVFTSSLRYGHPIPPYYANVVGSHQSIWQRKLLSILGLRNLLKYGLEIFYEMRASLFSGDLDAYERKKGPHKMKFFTGNVVDLDCTILRAHEREVLDSLNANQRMNNLPEFTSGADIARTEAGKAIVANLAATMIDAFVQRFKIPEEMWRQRCLLLNPHNASPTKGGGSHDSRPAVINGDITVARDHKDRGKSAVWVYENVGLHTFHVNVPNMDDVYGALLQAPYHLAKAWCVAHAELAQQQQNPQANNSQGCPIMTFFDDALSDSCFNAKWRQIELFLADRATVGTIPKILDDLQASRQDIFTPKFFEEDDASGSKELAAMIQLVEQAGLQGREAINSNRSRVVAIGSASAAAASPSALRSITRDDVIAWHTARNRYSYDL